METVMHDAGDTAEALLVPGIGNFFSSGRDTCGALKNGLQGDAMSGYGLLDNREDLRFRIKKCSKDRLVGMKMAELGLFGAKENYGCIFPR
jgi:hypothetical protein